MAHVSTQAAPFGAITVHRIASAASGLVARYNAWNAQRRTREVLSQLTPEQLEDIGLTKATVSDMFLIRG
ncbi:MAG: DUF1127 domain-containing protein [Pseudomonadota bacterium]